MLRRILSLIVVVALFGMTAVSSYAPVVAAATNPLQVGQALEIAPPVITLDVNPGQSTTVLIYLRDISKSNLLVTGQTDDFLAAGEDGTPKVILNSDTSDPYSMKSWVGALPSLTLIPREIKAMRVTITVPRTASPGGHYGVIRFTATPPNIDKTGVSLSASLGALLLLTVSGKLSEQVALQSFTASQNGQTGSLFEAPPITFSEVFKNTGNVHEQPTGQVVINDMLGHKFAAVNVNLPPRNVLPNSSRRFDEPLDSTVIGNKFMFGRYTAVLSVTYGTNGTLITQELVFWVIPYRLIIVIAVGLVAAFFLIRYSIRRYNRFIIGQARRSGY